MAHDTPPVDDAALEGTLVPPQEFAALQAVNRAEVDMQIATAKQYPRTIRKFQSECKEMACLSEETAESCFYALPRAGKVIRGPSARFAEIAMSAWQNCKGAARIIGEDDRFVTAQGIFIDLQRNIAVSYEVRRRITDKKGRKFNDDMIVVTSNAAASIAMRNAVLKGIPKAYWNPIYQDVLETALGKAKSIAERRDTMLAYFAKMGVDSERVLAAIEKVAIEDVGVEDLLTLKGLATALKEGDTTIEDAFPDIEGQKLAKALSKPKDSATPPAEPVSEPAPTAPEPAPTPPAGDPEGLRAQAAMKYANLLAECTSPTSVDYKVIAYAKADPDLADYPETRAQIVQKAEQRKLELQAKQGKAVTDDASAS